MNSSSTSLFLLHTDNLTSSLYRFMPNIGLLKNFVQTSLPIILSPDGHMSHYLAFSKNAIMVIS